MHPIDRLSVPGLVLLTALILGAPAAALTIDFEDLGLNLPVNSDSDPELEDYYNGYSASVASQPTDFASSGATFNNDFTDFGGGCCWQGWAYSQTTDTTTPGFENQYSAIAGSGAGGSATYGVAFTGGQVGAQSAVSRIVFDQEVSPIGAAFTNTTYAALSMRDGDEFSEPFGGPSGSDPDYFILTIIGRDAANAVTGTAELVLADYRFENDALDYIVMEWTAVDLTGLGSVVALEFELDSNDQSFGYLNKPAYFALDELAFAPVPEPAGAALLALGLALLARRRP